MKYDATAEIVDVLDDLPYPGASLIRDTIRSMYRLEYADSFDGGSGVQEEEANDGDDEEGQEGGEQAQSGTPIGPYVAISAFPALNLLATP